MPSSEPPKDAGGQSGVGDKPNTLTPSLSRHADAASPTYTAKEAAKFVRQGASMVALPPDEVWRDSFVGPEGDGVTTPVGSARKG